ncbi:MAG TPA: PDZ domain-containing protein [Candidatus Binataceae bacterium]|nr:PDZ domain-containing protein [Candidatus Binataceae bacterium]
MPQQPPPGSLPQYLSEESVSSPIGFELREARRKLSSGEEADGLLIIDVKQGSPAAQVGLKPYKHGAHDVLTGAAIAGALFFPPAIALVPVLDFTQFGESYDMIIGVDGSRVSNFLDFEDRTHDLQPGEIVYLSVVRNGKRLQVSVPVPPNISSLTY